MDGSAAEATHNTLSEASEFVHIIQHRQWLLVGCPEEVAYLKGFIDTSKLRELAAKNGKTVHRQYLERLMIEIEE